MTNARCLPVVVAGPSMSGWATSWVVLAFLPGTWAALRAEPERDIRTVGWQEAAHLTWFVLALIASYHA